MRGYALGRKIVSLCRAPFGNGLISLLVLPQSTNPVRIFPLFHARTEFIDPPTKGNMNERADRGMGRMLSSFTNGKMFPTIWSIHSAAPSFPPPFCISFFHSDLWLLFPISSPFAEVVERKSSPTRTPTYQVTFHRARMYSTDSRIFQLAIYLKII